MNLPKHVAIIMDGNGRWANRQGKERLFGHKNGAQVVRKITTFARKIGIKALTLYAFSEQNWNRPEEEVEGLMELLKKYIIAERKEILDNGIRFTAIGNLDKLSPDIQELISDMTEVSKNNQGMDFSIALSYGSQQEIVTAVRKIAAKCKQHKLEPEQINEETINSHLFTSHLPPLDLIIRTSGELRLSNFMLWQAAYAEFYFSQTAWPDFNEDEFEKALEEYSKRERRFGRTEGKKQ